MIDDALLATQLNVCDLQHLFLLRPLYNVLRFTFTCDH